MSQSLEINKLGPQSNCRTPSKRHSIKRPGNYSLLRLDDDFIRGHSDGDALVSASRTVSSVWSRKPAIRIFVVYDSDLNRDRARHMERELGQRLNGSFDILVSSWKLKSLWHPKMLQLAADAITKADIILFSLPCGGELPQAAINWIERRLLDDTTHRVSLLALLETGGVIVPQLSPAEIYVSRLASKVGVDCLCYSDGIPLARASRNRRQRPWGKKKVCSTVRLMSAELRE